MLGGIVAILIVVWFYRSARELGLPDVQWAVAGLIAFYVPNFIWSLMIAKPWMNSLHAKNAMVMAGFVGFSSVFIGALCALLVRQMILLKRSKA